jgi:hypothetical protein
MSGQAGNPADLTVGGENDENTNPLNPDATGLGAEAEELPTSKKEFPATYTNHRPKYDAQDPEKVLDYIKQCEDVMMACKITTDRIKKKVLVHYLDSLEHSYWTQMTNYKTGTYEEFKEEILRMHPAALAQKKGGMARLRGVCAAYQNIRLETYGDLVKFHLLFKAETAKMASTAVSNRELTELYLSTLSVEFRREVLRSVGQAHDFEKNRDFITGAQSLSYLKYMTIAENLAGVEHKFQEGLSLSGQQGTRTAYEGPSTFPIKEESTKAATAERSSAPQWALAASKQEQFNIEQLSQSVMKGVASVLDQKMLEHDKKIEHQLEELRSARERMELLIKHPHNLTQGQPLRNPRPPNPRYNDQQGPQRSAAEGICFYCNLNGHFIGDCPARTVHVAAGKVYVN